MFFLGLLSLVQIGFLPGYILLHFFKAKTNVVQNLIFSFALSLIFNYCLALVLVSVGIYHRLTVCCLFVMELIILGFITDFETVKNWLLKPSRESLASVKSYFSAERYMKDNYNKVTRGIVKTSLFLALVAIILVIYQLFNQWGTVFQLWDAVVSWNRWALDWFHNQYPSQTWHYPQLIPSNWSISYLFLARPIQFFPKVIMSCFTLYLLLLIFDLARTKRSLAYLIGEVFVGYLYLYNFKKEITDGCVDIAVSFMIFLAVYCLLIISKNDSEEKRLKFLILGSIFASGSAVTKQAGLYILFVYPLIAVLLIRKDLAINKTNWYKFTLSYISGIVVLVLPFYILTQIRITLGLDSSEINTVTNLIFHGKNLFERFLSSTQLTSLLFDNGSIFFVFCLIALLSCRDKSYRSISLFLLIPYYLIWALFFSYDIRNLIPIMPVFGLAIALGLREIYHIVPRLSIKLGSQFSNVSVVGFTLLFLIFLNFHYSPASLVKMHVESEKMVVNPELNQLLYKYYAENKITKMILTDYQPLGFLPNLKKFYKLQWFTVNSPEQMRDFELSIKRKENGYLLLPDSSSNSIQDDVLKKERSRDFKDIFHAYGYKFIKINEDER